MMETILPIVFVYIMGFALLLYVILDGYDLGIGLLFPLADDQDKDLMIASIGPFWDANETWIVLGVGVLLIAFPQAHGEILTKLYLPVTLMLMGLILRGVAFEFRAKSSIDKKPMWNRGFFLGSLIASCAQGWMLGHYITGLQDHGISIVFALLIALALPALYIVLGAGWVVDQNRGRVIRSCPEVGENRALSHGGGTTIDLHRHTHGQRRDRLKMVCDAQYHWTNPHSAGERNHPGDGLLVVESCQSHYSDEPMDGIRRNSPDLRAFGHRSGL